MQTLKTKPDFNRFYERDPKGCDTPVIINQSRQWERDAIRAFEGTGPYGFAGVISNRVKACLSDEVILNSRWAVVK